MIPGEILTDDGEHELNAGRATLTLVVANTGDRPVQVGSHYHFFEVNDALSFDRAATRCDWPMPSRITFPPPNFTSSP